MAPLRVLAFVLVVVGAACASTVEDSGTTTLAAETLPRPLPSEAPPTPPSPRATAVAGVAAAVEDVRGLAFRTPVPVVVVDGAGFDARFARLVAVAPALDRPGDAALMEALGVLPPGSDPATLVASLYGDDLAGFYDEATGELVVRDGTAGLSPLEEVELAGELVRALTDQHFAVAAESRRLRAAGEGEAAAGLEYLAAGDGELHRLRYFNEVLTPAEQVEAGRQILSLDDAAVALVPTYTAEKALLPARAGLELVEALVATGGPGAIDAAYGRPPQTTEQAMDLERYRTNEPAVAVALAATAPAGFEPVAEGVVGQARWQAMLLESVGAGQAVRAASGWGGDTYRVWSDGNSAVVAIAYAGDRDQDAVELETALAVHVRRLLGLAPPPPVDDDDAPDPAPPPVELSSPAGFAFLQRRAENLVVVVAGDPDAGREVAAVLAS